MNGSASNLRRRGSDRVGLPGQTLREEREGTNGGRASHRLSRYDNQQKDHRSLLGQLRLGSNPEPLF